MNKTLKISLDENISIIDSVSVSTESQYLMQSNKKKLTEMLVKSNLDQDSLIDIFISLHLVLEIGVNSLFRHIVRPTLKKQVDVHDMINNLDNINYIDKTTMFIYYSEFNFTDNIKASNFHSIIGKMKNFSFMRNKLLHGHSISSVFDGEKNSASPLKEKLNLEYLQKQINDFKFIIDGLCFYLDCLEYGPTKSGKMSFKSEFLDHSFLPHTSFKL